MASLVVGCSASVRCTPSHPRASAMRPKPTLRQHFLSSTSAPRHGQAWRQRGHAIWGSSSTASTCSIPADSKHFKDDQRPVILFDGVCNLCNGGVNFMLDFDTKGVYRMAALQSEAGRELLPRCGRRSDDISSIVLVERDGCFTKSDAVLRIASRLSIPLQLLGGLAQPLPLFVRDAVYDQIADNRYTVFGRSASCRLSDDRFTERFISN